MTPHTDDPIGTSLAALETSGASPGFTRRVVERLTARRERRRRRRRLVGRAGAGIAVAAALGVSIFMNTSPMSESEIASEKERLKAEYAQLQSDLEQLRSSARETAPVLYLGGNDEVDLVLDLAPIINPLAPAGFAGSATEADPFEL